MTVQERLAQHLGRTPDTAQANFVADNATVIGDVTLGPKSSVFYGAVLRGDIARIVLGEGSNIQDNAIVHLADDGDAIIGNYCTIGHGAIVHACTIGDECLIGMGSIVLDRAVLQDRVMVGAGSLVPPGKVLRSGYLYLGSPVREIRALTEEELASFNYSADNYVALMKKYRDG